MTQKEMNQTAQTIAEAVNQQLKLHSSPLWLRFETIRPVGDGLEAYCRFQYMETNMHIDYEFDNWSTLSALAEWPEPRPLEWFGHIEMMAVQVMRLWEENYHLIKDHEATKALYEELKQEVKSALQEIDDDDLRVESVIQEMDYYEDEIDDYYEDEEDDGPIV